MSVAETGRPNQPAAEDCRLFWEVKESFRAYVGNLPDGSIRWRPGQRPGEFLFLGQGEDQRSQLQFSGGVRFAGHGGMLNVTLEDPVLELDWGVLRVTVRQAREPVAILKLGDPNVEQDGSGVVVTYRTPRLTADGAVIFGGPYPEGTVCDPVTVRMTAVGVAALTGVSQDT